MKECENTNKQYEKKNNNNKLLSGVTFFTITLGVTGTQLYIF